MAPPRRRRVRFFVRILCLTVVAVALVGRFRTTTHLTGNTEWILPQSDAVTDGSPSLGSTSASSVVLDDHRFNSLGNRNNTTSTFDGRFKKRKPVKKNKTTRAAVQKYPAAAFVNLTILSPNDAVYRKGSWDGSPVVLKDHKLLFFTTPKVGCSVWKQLFRRMQGLDDWRTQDEALPHNPLKNGLTYLHDFTPAQADRMLTDPAWTRAIFVRDPKERFLSAYLDKVVSDDGKYVRRHCCPKQKTNINMIGNSRFGRPTTALSPEITAMHKLLQCPTTDISDRTGSSSGVTNSESSPLPSKQPQQQLSFQEFVSVVFPACQDPHWQPQVERLSTSVWSTINFVGHLEHVESDAMELLQRIGAWKDFGQTEWGRNGDQSIFQGTDDLTHATDSARRFREYYTASLEKTVESLYEQDYDHAAVLNLERTRRTASKRIVLV